MKRRRSQFDESSPGSICGADARNSFPGMNLAFLNSRNTLCSEPDYEPQLYIRIDRDLLEPSDWEKLVPRTSGLADTAEAYRQGRGWADFPLQETHIPALLICYFVISFIHLIISSRS
jgi:hypothetical protein